MKIAIVGTGYVGLVTGACFAEMGNNTVCVDIDEQKLAGLRQGILPIHEPGLEQMVVANTSAARLVFSSDLSAAISDAEVVFIAVGTPPNEDGSADLSHVLAVAKSIGQNLQHPIVVVNKSTVPVGTADKVNEALRAELDQRGVDIDFDVVSNPEFLREGSAVQDFMYPDRIVVGAGNPKSERVMEELYGSFAKKQDRIQFVGIRDAEMIKYAANAFLATKISFINEMADLCEKVGADVQDVARGIGLDGRIGKKFLNAGPGYGGSCFPKDTNALVNTAREAGAPTAIVEAVVGVNDRRKQAMATRIIDACGGDVSGKTIGILGVAFKPNTDDMRDAPSLDIIPALQKAGATVKAYDPEGMREAREMLDDVVWCEGTYETLADADIVAIITEWNEFRGLDLERVKSLLKKPVMVDLRNIYDPVDMKNAGFTYFGIGRGTATVDSDV